MNKTFKLSENIEYGKFYSLLDQCSELCDYFTFTKNGYESNSNGLRHAYFLDCMYKFFTKKIVTRHWFSYYVPPNYIIEIFLYKMNRDAIKIMKDHFDNLYLRERLLNGDKGNVGELPEDLCFFAKGKLLLGTVSHESICYLYPPSEYIKSRFLKLGQWIEIDYSKEEHIKL